MMRSFRRWLAGAVLTSLLGTLASGCGGGGGLEKVPEEAKSGAPDMNRMPGFDASSGQMKTEKAKK